MFEACSDLNEPVCLTPLLCSALTVPLIPAWPWSTEWFEAVSHASQPLRWIEAARPVGVLKIG